jgi:hypothetical protein
MKISKLILLLACIIPYFISAQINEGYIQFHIDVNAVDTSTQAKQSASMLRNSKMEIYFANDLSRIDFQLGELSKTSVRINRKTNKGISISESVMGKFANVGTAENLAGETVATNDSNVIITPFNEFKTILGFKCQKYVMENNGLITTYWCTQEINLDNVGQVVVNSNLPGFPLAFTSIEKGLRMHFQASNFKEVISNKEEVFSTSPPEGYQIMAR